MQARKPEGGVRPLSPVIYPLCSFPVLLLGITGGEFWLTPAELEQELLLQPPPNPALQRSVRGQVRPLVPVCTTRRVSPGSKAPPRAPRTPEGIRQSLRDGGHSCIQTPDEGVVTHEGVQLQALVASQRSRKEAARRLPPPPSTTRSVETEVLAS